MSRVGQPKGTVRMPLHDGLEEFFKRVAEESAGKRRIRGDVLELLDEITLPVTDGVQRSGVGGECVQMNGAAIWIDGRFVRLERRKLLHWHGPFPGIKDIKGQPCFHNSQNYEMTRVRPGLRGHCLPKGDAHPSTCYDQ